METSKEKIFYNAFNIVSESNYGFLNALKGIWPSYESAWLDGNLGKVAQFYNIQEQTLKTITQKKKELDPEKEFQKLITLKISLFLLSDPEYPALLKEIPSPPLGIYQKGVFNHESFKLGVVGTRRATIYGKSVTEKITKELIKYKIGIVSGLALGIDTFAHHTTADFGGETIAVLGSGIDNIFPSINKKLAEKIINNNGAIISEYPINTPPLKHHFPARNRIISGLSQGVLVVEAPEKSGALITARFALDQNRDVFAIPGPIFSQNSKGTNELIKAGAKLVTQAEDILTELNIDFESENNEKVLPSGLTDFELIIFEIIKQAEAPINVDEIINLSEMEPSIVNQNLTFLELKNLVKSENNGYRIIF